MVLIIVVLLAILRSLLRFIYEGVAEIILGSYLLHSPDCPLSRMVAEDLQLRGRKGNLSSLPAK